MGLANTLKPIVDLPVFEWMKQCPATTTSTSCAISDGKRYAYFAYAGNNFLRYDTFADTWQTLASIPPIPGGADYVFRAMYDPNRGYYGEAISAPNSTSLQIAGLNGQELVGFEIEIYAGTGAGQKRTITAVANPVVHDSGIATSVNTTPPAYLTDASQYPGNKYWTPNRWRNYQLRLTYGTGQVQMRRILYNTNNTLCWYSQNTAAFDPWWGAMLPTNPAGYATLYQIESSIITVDSPWTVTPDSTSRYVVKSGAVWFAAGYTSVAPYYVWMYYDILADVWYLKGTCKTHLSGILSGQDIGMESPLIKPTTLTQTAGTVSTVASPHNVHTLVDSGQSMSINLYANCRLALTGGTGMGQYRTILSNNATTFFVTRNWEVQPDATTTYVVTADPDKLHMILGTSSTLFQYSVDADQMACHRQLEDGVARTFAAKRYVASSTVGLPSIGIQSITRSIGGIAACAVNAAGTGYHVGDVLTCTTTGSGGLIRVTSINTSTGAVTGVEILNPGSGYSASSTSATSSNPSIGSGCTISISTVTETAVVNTGTLPHNFKVGDVVAITGAVEGGYNGNKTLIGSGFDQYGSVSNSSFMYATSGLAGNATAANAQSTSQLVDAAANWVADEHIGNLVQIGGVGTNQTIYLRRISDNTSTTLVWSSTIASAPTTAVSKYVILDAKALGTDSTFKTDISKQPWGFATGGTTTTLIDTSKSWPPNFWVGRKVRILTGKGWDTANGALFTVTANDATSLTVSSFGFTPDTTTCYELLDNFGQVASGASNNFADSTQNWPYFSNNSVMNNKRVRFTSGTYAGAEYTITGALNATCLTFPSGNLIDATHTYAVLGVNTRSSGTCLFRVSNNGPENLRNKLVSFRGGASPTIDVYDIGRGVWDVISQVPNTDTYTIGTMYGYNDANRIYFTKDATGRVYYLDLATYRIVPVGTIPYAMSAAIFGDRLFTVTSSELQAAGLEYLYLMRHSASDMWRVLVFT